MILLLVGWEWLGSGQLLAADRSLEPALDDVIAAWKAREQAVRSAQFQWKGSMTHVSSAWELDHKAAPDAQKVLSGEMVRSLILDGQQLRLSSGGPRFASMPDGHLEWGEQTYTHVLATEEEVVHFLSKKQLDPLVAPSNGSIHSAKGSDGASRNFEVDPILMHFRALDPKLSNIQGHLSATKRTGMVEGRRCWIIWEDGLRNTEYWVDPQRAYAIVRMRTFSFSKPGQCVVDTEISYEPDPRIQWVPSSWRGSLLDQDTGKVRKSCAYTVVSYSINPGVDPKVFQYQFPPGTRVSDWRQTPLLQYIVREGGGKRVITDAESGAPYQDLLKTETGEAALQMRRPENLHWLLVVVLLSLLGALLLAFIARRRRFRRA
jgi:hypothetical protein